MNPWLLLGLGLIWLASLVGAYHHGYGTHEGEVAKEKVIEQRVAEAFKTENQVFSDALGLRIETAFGKIRNTTTTINNEVRHEREIQSRILNDPNCALPASTVLLLNRARGREDGGPGGPGTGQPAGTLPADGKAGVAGRPSPGR